MVSAEEAHINKQVQLSSIKADKGIMLRVPKYRFSVPVAVNFCPRIYGLYHYFFCSFTGVVYNLFLFQIKT